MSHLGVSGLAGVDVKLGGRDLWTLADQTDVRVVASALGIHRDSALHYVGFNHPVLTSAAPPADRHVQAGWVTHG